jgi:hypothetical protein
MLVHRKEITLAVCLMMLALAAAPALWAADVDGKWRFVLDTPVGERITPMEIKVQGDNVSGSASAAEGGPTIEIKGTYVNGEIDIRFPYNSEEAGVTADLIFKGKLNGDEISGEWIFDQYSGPFKATRVKA